MFPGQVALRGRGRYHRRVRVTHSLSGINFQQEYAHCSVCGPLTPVYVSINRETGRKSAQCMAAQRAATAVRRLQADRDRARNAAAEELARKKAQARAEYEEAERQEKIAALREQYLRDLEQGSA